MRPMQLAQIVWAESRNFTLPVGVPYEQMQMVRRAIADAALATAGRGFAAPIELPVSTGMDTSEAESCLAAAQDAITAGTKTATPTVIATGAADGTPLFGDLALRSGWRNNATDIETFGPIHIADAPGSTYFLFRARAASTGDTRPGYLFERPLTAPAATPEATHVQPSIAPPLKPKILLGMAVFVAALLLMMAASLLCSSIGWIALASNQQFHLTDAAAAQSCVTNAVQGAERSWPISTTDALTPLAERTDCHARWVRAVTAVVEGRASPPVEEYFSGDWLATAGRMLLRLTGGTHSLQLALVGLIGGIGLLLAAAGLVTQGKVDGALIDERNRISLTRTQLIAWSTVLLAGLWAFGLTNVGLSGQLFYALQTAEAPEGSLPVIFPRLEASLLALLGISTATPIFSRLILNRERATEVEAVSTRDNRPEERMTPRESSYTDLFQGETVGKASVVDIARVQHLAITGFLLGTYLTLLWQLAGAINGAAVVRSLSQGMSLYPMMPAIDGTFLQLLLFSHAGLVVGKLADRRVGDDPKT